MPKTQKTKTQRLSPLCPGLLCTTPTTQQTQPELGFFIIWSCSKSSFVSNFFSQRGKEKDNLIRDKKSVYHTLLGCSGKTHTKLLGTCPRQQRRMPQDEGVSPHHRTIRPQRADPTCQGALHFKQIKMKCRRTFCCTDDLKSTTPTSACRVTVILLGLCVCYRCIVLQLITYFFSVFLFSY